MQTKEKHLFDRQIELLAVQDEYNKAIVICEQMGFDGLKQYYIDERAKINEEMHRISEAK